MPFDELAIMSGMANEYEAIEVNGDYDEDIDSSDDRNIKVRYAYPGQRYGEARTWLDFGEDANY